jgi:hypothetical protein
LGVLSYKIGIKKHSQLRIPNLLTLIYICTMKW